MWVSELPCSLVDVYSMAANTESPTEPATHHGEEGQLTTHLSESELQALVSISLNSTAKQTRNMSVFSKEQSIWSNNEHGCYGRIYIGNIQHKVISSVVKNLM